MFDLTTLFTSPTQGQTQTASTAGAPAGAASPASYGMGFLPLLLIFLVFYVLLIRPQQKKLDQQTKMIKALSRGDRVITAGGIHGKIVKLLDDAEQVMVEIADGVQVKVVRNTIVGLSAKPEPSTPKSANSDDPSSKTDKKS